MVATLLFVVLDEINFVLADRKDPISESNPSREPRERFAPTYTKKKCFASPARVPNVRIYPCFFFLSARKFSVVRRIYNNFLAIFARKFSPVINY